MVGEIFLHQYDVGAGYLWEICPVAFHTFHSKRNTSLVKTLVGDEFCLGWIFLC